MKAWTLVTHGDPIRAFALRTHPDPVPTEHQVLIEVEGFGLNYADVMAVRGLYREAPPLPSIIGYEVVGRVVGRGSGVPEHLMGRRVVGMTRFGGYATLAVTDHRACAPIPDELSVGEACALATQGATAWYMARVLCPLHEGERVLVHSAAGGVGQLLVQLALASGCTVYGVAGGPAKAARLKELGVHHVIDRRTGYTEATLRGLLGPHRLDVSFNAVAGSTFRSDMRLLGNGGRLVLYGGAERGALRPFGTLRFVWRMGLVLPIFLMMRSRSILGVNMLKLGDHHPEVVARSLHAAVAACGDGVLLPRVYREFAHDKLPAAHAALAGGDTMGKVVVRW